MRTTSPRCPIHRVQLTCRRCAVAKAGATKSPAKALAARQNGAKGGRPRRGTAEVVNRRGRPESGG